MPDRWDCIFVDRIETDRTIKLTNPMKYGRIYGDGKGQPVDHPKARKTIPSWQPFRDNTPRSTLLRAIAMSIALNQSELNVSNGLILRAFQARVPYPGLQTALIKTRG